MTSLSHYQTAKYRLRMVGRLDHQHSLVYFINFALTENLNNNLKFSQISHILVAAGKTL